MSLRRVMIGLFLLAPFCGPAIAQVALTPADPDATLVEEFVVTARDAGPAWWTVSDADSTVYVLGSPTLAPKRMQWDRSVFERRLAGANQVILPFQNIRVKTKGALGSALNYLRLKSGPYEDKLDPAGRARFAAARGSIGQPPKRYGTGNALAAGLLLASDYRDRHELTTSDPSKLIEYLTRQAGRPVVERSYDIGPLLGAIIRTPKASGQACLNEVLAQVEAGPGVTRGAAVAWADGDVRGALDNERTYERCIALTPGAAALDARIKGDTAAAIRKALETPGHSIAVVPLRPLLAQGGVLDRLRAEGLAVKTPGEE